MCYSVLLSGRGKCPKINHQVLLVLNARLRHEFCFSKYIWHNFGKLHLCFFSISLFLVALDHLLSYINENEIVLNVCGGGGKNNKIQFLYFHNVFILPLFHYCYKLDILY